MYINVKAAKICILKGESKMSLRPSLDRALKHI